MQVTPAGDLVNKTSAVIKLTNGVVVRLRAVDFAYWAARTQLPVELQSEIENFIRMEAGSGDFLDQIKAQLQVPGELMKSLKAEFETLSDFAMVAVVEPKLVKTPPNRERGEAHVEDIGIEGLRDIFGFLNRPIVHLKMFSEQQALGMEIVAGFGGHGRVPVEADRPPNDDPGTDGDRESLD